MRPPDFIRARAKSLRRATTQPERLLWSLLRRNQSGLHFRRQHPVGPFILDFYCAAAKLAIEVDGPVRAGRQDHDERRTAWLATEGVRVLRFTTAEIQTRPAAVLKAIAQARYPLHRLTAVPLPRERERRPDSRRRWPGMDQSGRRPPPRPTLTTPFTSRSARHSHPRSIVNLRPGE